MANKQAIKSSEARLLIYLSQVAPQLRYMMAMSVKLDMDYCYLNKIIRGLLYKGWIQVGNSLIKNKKFYDITRLGISKLELAQAQLSKVEE